MDSISVLIIEDEAIWLKQLQISVANLGFTIAASYDDAAVAISNIATVNFDIALLDIRMNGSNVGIELGKIINTLYKKPIIFITSGTDKATIAQAITAKPSAYLIKPVNEASLFVAIQTAIDNFVQEKTAVLENTPIVADSFFIKTGNRYKKIIWADVAALSVEGRYTKVQLYNDAVEYLIGNSLTKTITTILPLVLKPSFVQINRNEFVNLHHIEELNGNLVKTKLHHFQVSENFSKDVRDKLNIVS